MTTYRDIAQALVAANFLDKADLDAATAVLANKLTVINVSYTEQMAAAQADEVRQEEVIADATEMSILGTHRASLELSPPVPTIPTSSYE